MDEYNQQMLEQDVVVKIDQWQKNQGDVPGTLKRRSGTLTMESSALSPSLAVGLQSLQRPAIRWLNRTRSDPTKDPADHATGGASSTRL